jgi:hypothetical protein
MTKASRDEQATQLTDHERLDALVERSLRKLEDDAQGGKPPTPAQLGTVARLLERRDRRRELEEIRRLKTGDD